MTVQYGSCPLSKSSHTSAPGYEQLTTGASVGELFETSAMLAPQLGAPPTGTGPAPPDDVVPALAPPFGAPAAALPPVVAASPPAAVPTSVAPPSVTLPAPPVVPVAPLALPLALPLPLPSPFEGGAGC